MNPLQINIYKDRMQKAYVFGASVLYSERRILREDAPQGWCCYDLCGTAEDPRRPCKLVDQAEKNHAGTVLSYLPLKTGRSQSRLVKDELQLTAASATLSKFCPDEKIRMPEIPLRHLLRPASPKRRGFSMPRRRRETRSLALSAISASTLDTTDAKASTTPGGPEAPEHPGIPG